MGLTARYYMGSRDRTKQDLERLTGKSFKGFGSTVIPFDNSYPGFYHNCIFAAVQHKGEILKKFLQSPEVKKVIKREKIKVILFVDDRDYNCKHVFDMLQKEGKKLGFIHWYVFHCPPVQNS